MCFTDLFLVLTLVGVDEAREGELAGGVDPECVVRGVVLLVLRDDQRVGLGRLGLHHLAQVVGAVDAHPVLVGGRVVCTQGDWTGR